MGSIKIHWFCNSRYECKKGESWAFSFDDKTKQGTIKAYVLDSNDNTILEVTSGNSKNNIKVSKDDTYKVKIITEEHSGEFEISWKKRKVVKLISRGLVLCS